MKKYIILLIACVLPAAVYCQGKINVEKEKAAIIAVIDQESNAWINRDYESWKATYVQDEPFARISSSKTGFGGSNNWHRYDSTMQVNFKNNPEPRPVKYKNENYMIRLITPEVAWAVYVQNVFDSTDTKTGWSVQTRFLEKQKGVWKISYLAQVSGSSYEAETVEE